MPSLDAFVLVVDYNVSDVVSKFIGANPVDLVRYMMNVINPAVIQIQQSKPHAYENRGEVHQAIWLKANHRESELVKSITKLVLNLLRELNHVNADSEKHGLPPATLHAGLSDGRIQFNDGNASGDAISSARAYADHARKVKAILVVPVKMLGQVQSGIRQDLKSSILISENFIELRTTEGNQ